jgi:uncharacterized protein
VAREALLVLRHHDLAGIVRVVLFPLSGLPLARGLWRFTSLDVHTVRVLRITSVIARSSRGSKLMGGKT